MHALTNAPSLLIWSSLKRFRVNIRSRFSQSLPIYFLALQLSTPNPHLLQLFPSVQWPLHLRTGSCAILLLLAKSSYATRITGDVQCRSDQFYHLEEALLIRCSQGIQCAGNWWKCHDLALEAFVFDGLQRIFPQLYLISSMCEKVLSAYL